MTPADIDAGLRLCRLSRWNQLARDWELFLTLTPDGATVASDETGRVIGSVATMRYAAARWSPQAEAARTIPVPDTAYAASDVRPVLGSPEPARGSLAWIAMVLVDPARRGSGIGTALLQHALSQVADVTAVGLDATPLGQPLYEGLGFRACGTFTRMRREPAPLGPVPAPGSDQRLRHPLADEDRDNHSPVRRAIPADRDAIAALDAVATGLDRRAMLAWLQSGAPQLAWVYDATGGIEGVVLGRRGYAAVHMGPVIAPSTRVAAALVRASLSTPGRQAVLIDVADGRAGWRQEVEALGFRAQRPFTRMYRGDWRPLDEPGWIHASIGPEFG